MQDSLVWRIKRRNLSKARSPTRSLTRRHIAISLITPRGNSAKDCSENKSSLVADLVEPKDCSAAALQIRRGFPQHSPSLNRDFTARNRGHALGIQLVFCELNPVMKGFCCVAV